MSKQFDAFDGQVISCKLILSIGYAEIYKFKVWNGHEVHERLTNKIFSRILRESYLSCFPHSYRIPLNRRKRTKGNIRIIYRLQANRQTWRGEHSNIASTAKGLRNMWNLWESR